MNDVNNRIFREFTEFFDNVEKSASEISVTASAVLPAPMQVPFWV